MKQNTPPLPPLLLRLFEQIDSCGDDPVIWRQEDIPTADKELFANLIKQGLLKEAPSQTVTCISCDGAAEIKRSGPRGIRLTAICEECASVFTITECDALEYRTGWAAASKWAATLLGVQGESEAISENAHYLGLLKQDFEQSEIYLCRMMRGQTARTTYDKISESIRYDAVVISLSTLSARPAGNRLVVHPVQHILKIAENKAHLFPPSPSPKHRSTQPLQEQKNILYEEVRKKLATEFAPPLEHHEICNVITDKHSTWLSYKSNDGKPRVLTKRVTLEVIKSVLTDAGQTRRISGKFHSQ